MAGDSGGEVQFAMSVGVMAQQLVSDLVGAAERQSRGGGVEIVAASHSAVCERIAGVETDEIPTGRGGLYERSHSW